MSYHREKSYNDLPLLPPIQELETSLVLKKAIFAHRALAELKGTGPLIPNQSVLIRTIGLQEAKLSSEIENIVTTNDELYRAFTSRARQMVHTRRKYCIIMMLFGMDILL